MPPTPVTRRVTLAALLAAAHPAGAQTVASGRPIRIVVPFAPGGSPDIAARLVVGDLSRALGQPMVVDNRAGANGTIAVGQVARAAPDGTTLLMANLGSMAVNPAIYDRLPYDARADFAPIGRVGTSALVLAASPASGIRSVGELVARARAEPGRLTYSSGGNGSASHLAAALFTQRAGIEMAHVPYRSSPAAATAVAAGEVTCVFGGQGAIWPLAEGRQITVIALTGVGRERDHADAPTVAEGGIRDYDVVDWVGLLAPAGTPRPLVERLNAELNRILADPDVAARFALQGVTARPGTPEAFAALIAAEQEKWAAVARAAQIRVE